MFYVTLTVLCFYVVTHMLLDDVIIAGKDEEGDDYGEDDHDHAGHDHKHEEL